MVMQCSRQTTVSMSKKGVNKKTHKQPKNQNSQSDQNDFVKYKKCTILKVLIHVFHHVLLPSWEPFQKKAKCNIFTVICFFCICLGQNYINPLLWLFSWIFNVTKVFAFLIDTISRIYIWKCLHYFCPYLTKQNQAIPHFLLLCFINKTIPSSKNAPFPPQNCLTHKCLFVFQLPEIVFQD